jgi:uncharacterized membrane protein
MAGMKRWILAAALAALPAESRAGTLVCRFTEPFFTITYDSQSGTVTELSADVFDEDTGQPVPRVLAEGAKLVKFDTGDYHPGLRLEKDGKVILQLRLTGQGSDGMSDNIFPFEADRDGRIGGCETGKYQAFDVYDLLEDIGAPL